MRDHYPIVSLSSEFRRIYLQAVFSSQQALYNRSGRFELPYHIHLAFRTGVVFLIGLKGGAVGSLSDNIINRDVQKVVRLDCSGNVRKSLTNIVTSRLQKRIILELSDDREATEIEAQLDNETEERGDLEHHAVEVWEEENIDEQLILEDEQCRK